MPHSIKPMLATLVDKPFDSPDWVFEIKWDGYRAIAEIENHEVKLYSRNGLSFNQTFAPVVEDLKKLKITSAIFDGEIVVLDKKGKASFQNVQNYQRLKEGAVIYYVFDLLFLEGYDLREFTLLKRKELLKAALKSSSHVKYCDHVEKEGIKFFKKASEKGYEGMIAKEKEAPYHYGRSQRWLKIKSHQEQEAIICGFTEPKGSREHFGALLLGVFIDGKLTYTGHTGSGFDRQGLEEVYKKLAPLIQKNSPFEEKPKTRFPTTWVQPKLVCEISFAEWTKDNQMRQAIFQGLRVDKKPTEVTKERPMTTEKIAELKPIKVKKGFSQETLDTPKLEAQKKSAKVITDLSLTHLDKVFWPEEGYTKGDLIAYYEKVAPLILPYLKDRPETLIRYPHGIQGSHFFQKDTQSLKGGIRTEAVKHDEGDVHYLVIDNVKSLLYTINLGCIDLNPFNSRIQTLYNPDYLIIDLDPEDIGFEAVIETAQAVHHLLEELAIPSVCKTSGASGLHIYIPLKAKYTYEEATQFGKLLAHIVHGRIPAITSVERSPAKRQKKVYLDYLQNRFGQNVASAYSVRPKPGAPVSTPLKWSEVKKGLTPEQFTIKTVLKRFEKEGDLFKLVLGKGINLKQILTKIGKVS
jgi:bifunctional non-homologous end joining protein LigD